MQKSPNNPTAIFSPRGNWTFSITTPTCQRKATKMGEFWILARKQNLGAGQGGLWEAVTWGSPWPLSLMTQFCCDLCGLTAALAPTPEELCGKLVSRSRSVALPSVWSPGCAHKLINRERPAGLQLEQSWDRHGRGAPASTVSISFPSLHALRLEIAAQAILQFAMWKYSRHCAFFFFSSFFLLYLLFFFLLKHLTKWKQQTCTFKSGIFYCQGFVPTILHLTHRVKKNNF